MSTDVCVLSGLARVSPRRRAPVGPRTTPQFAFPLHHFASVHLDARQKT